MSYKKTHSKYRGIVLPPSPRLPPLLGNAKTFTPPPSTFTFAPYVLAITSPPLPLLRLHHSHPYNPDYLSPPSPSPYLCHHVMSLRHVIVSCQYVIHIITILIRYHLDNIYVNKLNMKSVINNISLVNDGLTVRVTTKSNVVRNYNFVKKSTAIRYYCSLVY